MAARAVRNYIKVLQVQEVEEQKYLRSEDQVEKDRASIFISKWHQIAKM